MKHLSLDVSGWMDVGVKDGITSSEFAALTKAAADSFADTTRRRDSGEIGFWELCDQQNIAHAAVEFATNLPDHIDTVVVLGIGGSSLGPHALHSALAKPGNGRRLCFPDNPDPQSFRVLLDSLSLKNTLFNVVTKSGGTAETVAQLLVVADKIETELGPDALRQHIVATTDPESGVLRKAVHERGLTSFPVPSNVGGRFSVLSAVGLLPAALAGIDVLGLLQGAQDVRDMVIGSRSSNTLQANPALALATLLYAHDNLRKRPMVVMMPYSDALYDCADWFRQLWAESLGKDGFGPTPIASRGATDQHSQLQLFSDGPDDKTYLFVSLQDRGEELTIPSGPFSEYPEFGYLSGHAMGELLDAELLGTRSSLTRGNRPNALLKLNSLSAHSVGAFFMLLQAATAFAGPLYGVNAFDQPGVEEAKKLAYAALGRSGYEEYKQHLEAGKQSDPRYCY